MTRDRTLNDKPLQILGRTGSLFTRLPRIFAEELGVTYDLVEIDDLAALEPNVYAGNPSLRMPILREDTSVLYGAQNICRALAERATTSPQIVWPEDLNDTLSRNAQELVWHGMAAQVQLLMGKYVGELPADNVFFAKARAGLKGSLGWLDEHAAEVVTALPKERDLSLFEVALFCLVDHLQFGPTVSVAHYTSLLEFARQFGTRRSAQSTSYQ